MSEIKIGSVDANLPVCCQADQRRQQIWLCRIWLCLAVLVIIGCSSSEPAISKGNVILVEKLKTSVAAKKMDWLEATAKQIDGARQQGKLSDQEYTALEPIVADARQGHWDDANARLTQLINAQHGR